MSGLMNRVRGTDRERGAVVMIFVLLLASGVLLGIGAFAVDSGQWYVARSQLQNGADGSALAVARTCALGACDLSTTGTAQTYASGNVNAGATVTVDTVCGGEVVNGSWSTDCPAPGSGELPCPGPPTSSTGSPIGNGYVETYLITHVTAALSRALPGNSGAAQPIHTCAQAAWGPAGLPGKGIGLTVSQCEWANDSAGGLAPPPPYPPYPAAGFEQLLLFHGQATDDPGPCPSIPSGGTPDLPGGFGHTVTDSSCQTIFDEATGWYDSDTGNAIPGVCKTAIEDAWASHAPILIPVYDQVNGQGAGGQYHLHTLAAFVITAFHIQSGNDTERSWLPGSPYSNKPPCKGNDTCLAGFFTTATAPGPIGSGPSYGVSAIQLTG